MADVKVDVKLNMPRILNKVENDAFGLEMAQEWAKIIDPYVPSTENKTLRNNIELKPFEITYKMRYSHYMYYGIVYGPNFGIDLNGNLTFNYLEAVEWRSPPKKYPTGRKIRYSKYPNELATDHWDQKAAQAGKTEQLAREMNKYLRRLK